MLQRLKEYLRGQGYEAFDENHRFEYPISGGGYEEVDGVLEPMGGICGVDVIDLRARRRGGQHFLVLRSEEHPRSWQEVRSLLESLGEKASRIRRAGIMDTQDLFSFAFPSGSRLSAVIRWAKRVGVGLYAVGHLNVTKLVKPVPGTKRPVVSKRPLAQVVDFDFDARLQEVGPKRTIEEYKEVLEKNLAELDRRFRASARALVGRWDICALVMTVLSTLIAVLLRIADPLTGLLIAAPFIAIVLGQVGGRIRDRLKPIRRLKHKHENWKAKFKAQTQSCEDSSENPGEVVECLKKLRAASVLPMYDILDWIFPIMA
jgi:hypothetical protein